jgi:hypothetical protein
MVLRTFIEAVCPDMPFHIAASSPLSYHARAGGLDHPAGGHDALTDQGRTEAAMIDGVVSRLSEIECCTSTSGALTVC